MNLRLKRKPRIARLLIVFTNLFVDFWQEKMKEQRGRLSLFPHFLMFLAIFTNLTPSSNEHIATLLAIFSNLRPERNELLARFLGSFADYRQERNEFSAQFYSYFSNLSSLLDFWQFSRS